MGEIVLDFCPINLYNILIYDEKRQNKYEKSEKITRKKGALEQKTHSNAFS